MGFITVKFIKKYELHPGNFRYPGDKLTVDLIKYRELLKLGVIKKDKK